MTRIARTLRPAAVVAALAVTLALSACGSDSETDSSADATVGGTELFKQLPADIRQDGVVSFGALWETPPIISVTATDTTKPVGEAPEIAAALGKELGIKVTWQNMQWPAQLPGVQSGTVDALFGQITNTAERETSVVDLIPFSKATLSLLVKKDTAGGVTSLADMCGKTIGVPVGSFQTAEVKAVSDAQCGGRAIELKEYQGATQAITAVNSGTIAAWLDTTASQVVATKANQALAAVVVPENEVAPTYTSIAVNKNQPELTKALLAAMAEIVKDGTYADIMAANDDAVSAISADEVTANPITGTPIGETAK